MPKDTQIVPPHYPGGPCATRWHAVALGAVLISGTALAGWDCQPSAAGGWICNAEPATGTTPDPTDQPADDGRAGDVTPAEQPPPALPLAPPPAALPDAPPPSPPPVEATQPAPEAAPPPAAATPFTPRAPDPEPPAAPPARTTIDTGADTTPVGGAAEGPELAERDATPAAVVTPVETAETPVEPTAGEFTESTPAATERPVMVVIPRAGETMAGTDSARDLDTGIDWERCGPAAGTAAFLTAAPDSGLAPTVIEAEADAAELDRDTDSALLTGNVRFFYGAQTLAADRVVYNRGEGRVTAEGDVLLQRPDARLAGNHLEMQIDGQSGTLTAAEYRVPAINARGTADRAEFGGNRVSRYANITYTTCRPGNDDWLLQADALELDHIEGVATADAATLRFLGVPIAYLPRFTFPIDDRRRSGVLVPSVGYSSNTGADISVPYYLNLAPNYDLTLVPRVMSKRGIALGGEFRFLTPQHQGTAVAEVVPHDREYLDGTARGSASLLTHSAWGQRLEGDIRFNYASDDDYVADLGDSLAATSLRQLERTGELNYFGNDWRLLGRVQHYQTLDRDITIAERPYARLPQVLLTLQHPDGVGGLTYHLRGEYVYFEKEGGVDGHRLDINPGVSLPLRRPWGYLEPKLAARYTRYELDDLSLTSLSDDAPDRSVGIFSLDSGLNFERRASLFGISTRQTLEPRLYYLYASHTEQDDLPVFDTTELDFNFDNLFRENRFNGADRHGDANRLTVALQSRTLASATGAEILKASLGQIFYFRDRKVTLPTGALDEDDRSAVVSELSARLSANWRVRGGVQWDPDDDFQQGLAQLHYSDGRDRVFNAAYRYRDNLLEQTDVAALWPLSPATSLIARWYYSQRENRTLEALAGIQYGRCCWRVRAVVRRFTDSDTDQYNTAFMLQLELNGLGSLGNDIDSLLERGIYGYQVRNDD